MNKATKTYLDIRNQQCENLNNQAMERPDYERQLQELPRKLQDELTREFGTYELEPNDLMRLMFILINNLYIAHIPDEQIEGELLEVALMIVQKFAILHELKFTVWNMEWPR